MGPGSRPLRGLGRDDKGGEMTQAVVSNQAARAGRLAGKRTIVTGAGSGIGRASARKFAAEGAAVLAVDRVKSAIEETVAQIVGAGGKAIGVTADVGAEAEVENFVARAVEAFGGLDAVYANAGISGGLLPLAEQTVEHWQEILRINLIGPFLAIKHAAPLMVRQGAVRGRVILREWDGGIGHKIGRIKHPEMEARGEQANQGAVESRFRDEAPLDGRGQGAVLGAATEVGSGL